MLSNLDRLNMYTLGSEIRQFFVKNELMANLRSLSFKEGKLYNEKLGISFFEIVVQTTEAFNSDYVGYFKFNKTKSTLILNPGHRLFAHKDSSAHTKFLVCIALALTWANQSGNRFYKKLRVAETAIHTNKSGYIMMTQAKDVTTIAQLAAFELLLPYHWYGKYGLSEISTGSKMPMQYVKAYENAAHYVSSLISETRTLISRATTTNKTACEKDKDTDDAGLNFLIDQAVSTAISCIFLN